MNKVSKIVIYIPDLKGGGAEKVYLNLANYWIEKGIKVTFILNKKQGEYLELLNKQIKVINLNVSRIREALIKLPFVLHKEKASVCIAAMWPITSLTVLIFKLFFIKKTKLIISDHVNLTESIKRETNFSFSLFKLILRFTYPFADGIICVSEGVKKEICKLAKIKKNKIKTIYNPLIDEKNLKKLEYYKNFKKNNTKTIISVGSLKEQKNHEMLIKLFSKIDDKIDVKLLIIGSGPLKDYLKKLIKSLNQSNRISIINFDKNIYKYYLQSHIFVLTSKWEGFGNVIVEALHCGLEVISSDCDFGPSEILEKGKYGFLFNLDEENKCSDKLIKLLKNNQLSFNEENFHKSFDFSISKISNQYLDYMNDLI